MSDQIRVEITGFETLIGFIERLPANLDQATRLGIQRWGRQVMQTSRSRYVPILSGDLARSGRVVGPYAHQGGQQMTLEFTEDYALDQHENPNYKHPRGGTSKYLVKAINDHLDELKGIVGEEIRNIR
jgi:hypothetical protein